MNNGCGVKPVICLECTLSMHHNISTYKFFKSMRKTARNKDCFVKTETQKESSTSSPTCAIKTETKSEFGVNFCDSLIRTLYIQHIFLIQERKREIYSFSFS